MRWKHLSLSLCISLRILNIYGETSPRAREECYGERDVKQATLL